MISELSSYYRFDEGAADTLYDLAAATNGVLTNMDVTNDWVLSGAALGDTAAYSWSTADLVLGSLDGDTVVTSAFSGNPTGVYLYRVDQAPNDTAQPLGVSYMDTTHYYGVFVGSGTSPRLNISMSYRTVLV